MPKVAKRKLNMTRMKRIVRYRTIKTSRQLVLIYSRYKRNRKKYRVSQPAVFPAYTCKNCFHEIQPQEFVDDCGICTQCGEYLRLSAIDRIMLIADIGSFHELYAQMKSENILSFPGYEEKLKTAMQETGNNEGFVCGTARIGGQRCAVGVLDPNFMMGSMGSVVGEKLVMLFEYAINYSLPVIIFSASGGARMQEGVLSLMQMARVSFAVSKHSREGLFYLSILTNPTTGGVLASFAMQGDIIIAEPKATIGFAGKRVIEGTLNHTLPSNFQTAEYCLSNGQIDAIVDRRKLRQIIADLLYVHSKKEKFFEKRRSVKNG